MTNRASRLDERTAMSAPSTEGKEQLARAERAVIRCAMGIVNSDGWAFQTEGGKNIVTYPGSMRRLEYAIARLKLARKAAKPRRRKYT